MYKKAGRCFRLLEIESDTTKKQLEYGTILDGAFIALPSLTL
jgi:hypothetical protein